MITTSTPWGFYGRQQELAQLRGEADNWFLRELRGRYDMRLQYVARHPGCDNARWH